VDIDTAILASGSGRDVGRPPTAGRGSPSPRLEDVDRPVGLVVELDLPSWGRRLAPREFDRVTGVAVGGVGEVVACLREGERTGPPGRSVRPMGEAPPDAMTGSGLGTYPVALTRGGHPQSPEGSDYESFMSSLA